METWTITVTNKGGATFDVDASRPLLETLEEQGVDLPYGCRYGGCITCAAKVTDGQVDQADQVALNNRQLNYGYAVLCVARPVSNCTLEVGWRATTSSAKPVPRPAQAARAQARDRHTTES